MATVTLGDGARLVYDDYDFSDPWTESEAVILIHGFSKNRLFWYPWISDLARRYRVIRLDQRGHGESSLPAPGFKMSTAPFAADLDEFLGGLGLESAHFVMAEFSTAVAVEFAINYPDRLRSLTLLGLGVNYQAWPVDHDAWARQLETEGPEAWARETNSLRLPPGADPALKSWYVQQQGRMPGWLMAAVMRYVKTVDLTDELPLVRCPTLVVSGDAARQQPIEVTEQAVSRMPDGRLVVVHDSPFNVMSARPQECVAATLAFLEQHTRTPAVPTLT
jgi:pimeloyl-ACP methyl ester carboxylesterase